MLLLKRHGDQEHDLLSQKGLDLNRGSAICAADELGKVK